MSLSRYQRNNNPSPNFVAGSSGGLAMALAATLR
jgi:hypothetical protein